MTDLDRQEWIEDAKGWIEQQPPRHGVEPPFDITLYHQRPWSYVLLTSTVHGDFYFKAVQPEFRHEVRVTEGLAERWPNLVSAPIASDAERGWLLLPDGGLRLREAASDNALPGHWRQLLPIHAEMQRALASETVWMLALGVSDRRPQSLPGRLKALAREPMIAGGDLPSALQPAEKRS